MGNCCSASPTDDSSVKKKNGRKQNPFSVDYSPATGSNGGGKLSVLKDPTGHDIGTRYDLDRELGRGEFGVTYLCTDRSSGEVFACKSISKKKLKTAIDVDDVRREVEIMRHLPPHPNIVSLKDTYEDENAVHLVMELCEGGELFDRIVARGHYTERAAAFVMRTIVEVVQMCHKHGVMHRDLKPENFLFSNKKESSPLKAIDFGLSIFFKPGERFTEIVGSPYYMAPEVLKRNYGPEIDVWSAGVILYILLCGVPPFWAETEQGVAQAIIRSVVDFKRDPWPRVSENAKDLVKRMLNPDPKRRLTAQQVLDHPWLQNAKKAPNVPLGENVRARLKQFYVMNKFKKRALRVVAEHLSVEEVAGIKDMFQMMDTTNSGKITLEELKVGLLKIGQQVSDPDVQMLMEAADVDGNGTLDYGEFVAVSIHIRKMGNDEHLHKAFTYFDQNKSGFIEIEELRDSLADDLGPNYEEVINDVIRDVDTDKDGRISYDEFAAMMKAGTDWRKASRQYSRERFNNLSLKLMKDGSLKVAELVLGEESFEANIRDYSKLIDGHSKENCIEDAERILKKMTEKGIYPDILTYITLVHMYGKVGNLDRAKEAFENLRSQGFQPDTRAYNSMIMAYVNAGLPKLGESLMREMEARDIKPTKEIYMELMRAFAQRGLVDGAHRIVNTMQIAGYDPDLESCTLLVEAYGQAGDPDHARSNFHYITKTDHKPDDRCTASMISAYEKKNLLDKALRLLLDLEKDGFEPGVATYTVLLDWLGKLQLVDEAEQVLRKISEKGETPFNIHVSLCDMYSRAGVEKKAREALGIIEGKKELLRGDEFERIVSGLLAGGLVKEANRVHELMQEQGYPSSERVKVALMAAQAIPRQRPRAR